MLFMWCIYNLLVHAYVGALTEGIMFISSILAIIRIDILKRNKGLRRKKKNYNIPFKVNIIDYYGTLKELFHNKYNALSFISHFNKYDKDRQILIKIFLDINKN